MTKKQQPATAIRCAIYCRKSSEEGLEQEFNSLDAQRESAEAFIRSQQHESWTCLPEHYEDGGFSGGNMDRPALTQLLSDISAGTVDAVVVYKVDRLSRSLLDFARIIETFEKHHVAFVSVTQQFNTATSMGRLVLNVLLSFAQFERELISERTRDKIAATRRKGKWSGGMPLLGYDVDPRGFKLVINEPEVVQVREIFGMYLQYKGLLPVVEELARRGWRTKSWTTRKGRQCGGHAFTRTGLHRLLTNVVYLGKVRYKEEIHAGEHAAIMDPATWQQVQETLHQQGTGNRARNRSQTCLKGLLRCRSCGCAMTPSFACKNGGRRYRYYICLNALKRGRKACPSRYVPGSAFEEFVLEQLHKLAEESDSGGREEKNVIPSLEEWHNLTNEEQIKRMRSWVERLEYDGSQAKLWMTIQPNALTPTGAKHRLGKKYEQPTSRTVECEVNFYRRGPKGRLIVYRRAETSEIACDVGRLPRITRLMALALRFDNLLNTGEVKDYAALARLGQVTPARVSQIMSLIHLSPSIQEEILFMSPIQHGRDPIHLAHLQPIARQWDWRTQGRLWSVLRQRCRELPKNESK